MEPTILSSLLNDHEISSYYHQESLNNLVDIIVQCKYIIQLTHTSSWCNSYSTCKVLSRNDYNSDCIILENENYNVQALYGIDIDENNIQSALNLFLTDANSKHVTPFGKMVLKEVGGQLSPKPPRLITFWLGDERPP